jgi:hypothetical protein
MLRVDRRIENFSHKPGEFRMLPMLKRTDREAKRNEARIRQAFLDVPMYLSHEGLTQVAADAGIKVSELNNGDFLLFINSTWNRVKLLGPRGVILYIAAPGGHRISHTFLKSLPEIFNSTSKFAYDEALAVHLKRFLGEHSVRRRRKNVSAISLTDSATDSPKAN